MLFVNDAYVVNGCVIVKAIDNDYPYVKYTALFLKSGKVDRYVGKVKKESFPVDVENFFEEEFFRFCEQNMAKFKVPSYLEIRKDLPRNCSGKIIRKNLK